MHLLDDLQRRGYEYGNGVISPDGNKFIVNIPKNASSYLLAWANNFGYTAALAHEFDHQVQELIVVLRDPVDRWVSGISQYINTYILSVEGPNGPIHGIENMTRYDRPMTVDEWISNYNQSVERILFDVISQFDDHVCPQYKFFHKLLPNATRKFFYINENFDSAIADYLNFSHLSNIDRHSGNLSDKINKIQKFFLARLNTRPELRQRLVDHYNTDYKLIKEIFNE
jgi:hypothetical protein